MGKSRRRAGAPGLGPRKRGTANSRLGTPDRSPGQTRRGGPTALEDVEPEVAHRQDPRGQRGAAAPGAGRLEALTTTDGDIDIRHSEPRNPKFPQMPGCLDQGPA
eukprot:5455020-Pyramimonas_sp.AAC.1